MKKTLPKLLLRSETLRTLATMDLARAIGGSNAADAVQSGAKQCPAQIVVDSGRIDCDTAR
jgi:hypothetical protein